MRSGKTAPCAEIENFGMNRSKAASNQENHRNVIAGIKQHQRCNIPLAMELSPAQCRAARALLKWTQQRLADASDVTKKTIADFEREARSPHARTLRDLRAALEAAGVAFTNGDEPGVRLRK